MRAWGADVLRLLANSRRCGARTSRATTSTASTASLATRARTVPAPPPATSRLPDGQPSDEPTARTVCGLGNPQEPDVFRDPASEEGVTPYPGSVRLLDHLAERGIKVAVVSSFVTLVPCSLQPGWPTGSTVVIDGDVAATAGLAGKPFPDTYLHAAVRRCGGCEIRRGRGRAVRTSRRATPETSGWSSASIAGSARTG